MMIRIVMKRLVIALTTLLASTSGLYAKVVDRTDAEMAAMNFFQTNATKTQASAGLTSVSMGSRDATYYVFNNKAGGFVIIAGDDAVDPVLAYSMEGSFPEGSVPGNLKWWLDQIAQQLEAASLTGGQTDWTKASSTPTGAVEVLMETAQWNQSAPFNDKCPVVTGSQKAVTGCVATASAIVCRYYKWPRQGSGTISYSYTDATGKTVNMPSRSLANTYDYDSMSLQYTKGSYTSRQADAVSTLILDCGYAVRMQYGPNSSSATSDMMTKAFVDHLGYSKEALLFHPYSYTLEQWEEMIKAELKKNRLVPYSGTDETLGGHQFVVDGCTTDNFFHVNWGWGGLANGYFKLNALAPKSTPAYNFAKTHCAILGLEPDKTGKSKYSDSFSFIYVGDTYPERAVYKGLVVKDGVQVKPGSKFTVLAGPFANTSTHNFTGITYIGLCDRTGKVKEKVSAECELKDCESFAAASGVQFCDFPCTINSTIRGGDRLRLIYEGQYSSGWCLSYDENCKSEIILAENDNFSPEEIAAATTLKYTAASKSLDLCCSYSVDWAFKDASGESLASGQTQDGEAWALDLSSCPSGTYTLYLQNGPEPFTLPVKL